MYVFDRTGASPRKTGKERFSDMHVCVCVCVCVYDGRVAAQNRHGALFRHASMYIYIIVCVCVCVCACVCVCVGRVRRRAKPARSAFQICSRKRRRRPSFRRTVASSASCGVAASSWPTASPTSCICRSCGFLAWVRAPSAWH
jgi:hypothetical protein